MTSRTWISGIAAAVCLLLVLGGVSVAAPKRTRAAVLADYRAHQPTGMDVYVNERIEAFKLADQGDLTKLRELRRQDCVGSMPRAGTYEEELCGLYADFFIPPNAPAAVNSATILAALHTDEPIPEHSFRAAYAAAVERCAGAAYCTSPRSVWEIHCKVEQEAVDSDVQHCEGVECAILAVRAAQVERVCTTPPPDVVTDDRQMSGCATCAVRPRANAGFTLFISRVGRARATSTAGAVQQCQAIGGATIRCVIPSATTASFDDYRRTVADLGRSLDPVLGKYFPDAAKEIQDELIGLDNQALAVEKRCAVPADSSLTEPQTFYARNGCLAANLTTAKVKQLRLAYEAAWSTHLEMVAEQNQQQATVDALQRARAEKETRDRAAAYQRQAQAKLASRECVVAEAWAQYCNTSDRLTNVEAAIAHQHRVDVASGTVDLRMKRQLAETKLVLKDQLTAAAKPFANFGLKASRGQCKPAPQRSQVVQDSCVLAASIADAPVPTNSGQDPTTKGVTAPPSQ